MSLSASPDRPLAPLATDEKYRVLFDSIDEGFCVVQVQFDDHGNADDYVFVEANPSFERQTGLVDAVGRRMRELAPQHEDHWFRTYGDVARTRNPTRFEARAEALRRWYDVYAFAVGDPGQDLVAVLFNDVSERKRAELERQEADRRKDEFIAILAHELRNPLAPLRNGLELMRLAADKRDKVEQARLMMARQVDQLVSLVDDLLDVSRISRGLIELDRNRVDMVSVLHQAIEAAEPLVRQRGHVLALQLPPDAVPVHADPMRMAQVVSNLLINAAKYTPPGGQLTLRLHKTEQDAVVCVADNGIGIPAHMLEHIFELFAQVETTGPQAQGGLGIGLAVVKQIVGMHGGSVRAESEGLGHGSRFTVHIPLAQGVDAVAMVNRSADRRRSAARRRILVADDNVDTAQSLTTMLEELGHDVRTAYDGEQAVDVARHFGPEIVLLDIGMPRLDGIAAAQRLRALPGGRRIVLVAVTGWGQARDVAATSAAGFDRHLVKPVALERLDDILRETADTIGMRP